MHPANVRRRLVLAIGAALPFVLNPATPVSLRAAGTPAPTQTTLIKVKLIEWDLPEQMDNTPGGMTADVQGDGSRIWFTTRVTQGDGPRLYQFDLHGGKKVNKGQWVSYELDQDLSGVANGLRKIRTSHDKDRRFVFVHTAISLQRIDTLDCKKAAGTIDPLIINGDCGRKAWLHDAATQADLTPDPNGPTNPESGSDVAIDDYNNVFTVSGALLPDGGIPAAGLAVPDWASFPAPTAVPGTSFVQRLIPDKTSNNVTRWYVGHNVGMCTSFSNPCLSGITYDKRRDRIYFSEPGDGLDDFGAIAELDMVHNAVRRWDFATLSTMTGDLIREPRQLNIDSDGKLWTVTGSGHLVSLDPGRNRMSKHKTPIFAAGDDAFTDLFGVAPDGGLIGYTDSSQITSKVGMLAPDRDFAIVGPKTVYVPSRILTIQPTPGRANRTSGTTPPQTKLVNGQRVKNGDGQFTEAVTNSGNDSFMPLGITPDMSASVGTFFYAVGDPGALVFNRIGRVRLPRDKERGRIERDDDDNDDDGKRNDVDDDVDDDGVKNAIDSDSDNDGTPDSMDDDDDNDGIEDSFDTKDHKETKQSSQQDLAAGTAAQDPFTVNPGTLLVVLSAISTDVLAPMTIDVVDAGGQVVVSSLASPGAAALTWIPPTAGGDYTLRVRNQSPTASTISTKILTRENWPLLGGLF
jgi:hypothetical protein